MINIMKRRKGAKIFPPFLMTINSDEFVFIRIEWLQLSWLPVCRFVRFG